MTTKETKKTAFAWDDKNTEEAIRLYNESGKDNSRKALAKIAETIGAKSAQAIRSKLAVEKVYVKNEAVDTSGKTKTVKVTKVSTVYALETLLGLKKESLDTLEKANAKALETLTTAVVNLGKKDAVITALESLISKGEIDHGEIEDFSDLITDYETNEAEEGEPEEGEPEEAA